MKVGYLINELLKCPLDADVIIEQYDSEGSCPNYRETYDPEYNKNAPYPENRKDHPKGVVVL